MTIHDRIRQARTAKGWSHQQLADEVSRLEGAKKTLTWQTVQQWENGASAPARKRQQFVAQALGVGLTELTAGEMKNGLSLSADEHRLLIAFNRTLRTDREKLLAQVEARAAEIEEIARQLRDEGDLDKSTAAPSKRRDAA